MLKSKEKQDEGWIWSGEYYSPRWKNRHCGKIPVRYTDVVYNDVQAIAFVMQQNDTRTIWVSCDMCHPTKRLTDDVIALLKKRLPDFHEDELILSATHATACFYLTDDEFLNSTFDVDLEAIMPLEETRSQVCEGIVVAVMKALESATECTVEFATAEILTGFCRRVLYKDGSAAMYGDVHRDDFLRMEYPDGAGTQILYFYTKESHSLIGIFAAVPCPAQMDENSVHITADYWAVVRERIAEEFGSEVMVFGVCRAAGELSPHRMLRLDAGVGGEDRGVEATRRLGNRIAQAVINERSFPVRVFDDENILLKAITTELNFPIRTPSLEEIEHATQYLNNPANFDENGNAIDWKEKAKAAHVYKVSKMQDKYYKARIHLLRMGDVLFCTAPSELFVEYANQIRTKFPKHTVVDVQLTDDGLGYLPTAEAINHGGYSTMIFSTVTTPEGGQMYVEETVKLLERLL
jgi:hypothetical protein